MGLSGTLDIHGIEFDSAYVRITRFQVRKEYQQFGEGNLIGVLYIDYDFDLFKNKSQSVAEYNNPLKKYQRNKFAQQCNSDDVNDVFDMIYTHIKTNVLFTNFTME